MKTKNILLIAAFALMVSSAIGQEKTTIGFLGGVNFQNLNGEDTDGKKLENQMILGYHIGVNVQIPLAPEFYIQPGLQLSTKGAKDKNGDITNTYRLSYIELPLNFLYKAALGDGHMMLGFGPYVAYGIGGKANFEDASTSHETNIKFQNEVGTGDALDVVYLKPLDFGGNILFGYELAGGLLMQLNAQLGMSNISPDYAIAPNSKSILKNTGFGLSLGYRL
jgi:Outer membrane protein beta-barrel domain